MGGFAAGKRGMAAGSPEANRMTAVAIQELTGVLEGPYGAAERSSALQALLWTQVGFQTLCVPIADLSHGHYLAMQPTLLYRLWTCCMAIIHQFYQLFPQANHAQPPHAVHLTCEGRCPKQEA